MNIPNVEDMYIEYKRKLYLVDILHSNKLKMYIIISKY